MIKSQNLTFCLISLTFYLNIYTKYGQKNSIKPVFISYIFTIRNVLLFIIYFYIRICHFRQKHPSFKTRENPALDSPSCPFQNKSAFEGFVVFVLFKVKLIMKLLLLHTTPDFLHTNKCLQNHRSFVVFFIIKVEKQSVGSFLCLSY